MVGGLSYVNGKALMQLQDMKEGIDFPGYWGFFGGSIDEGEVPEEASKRELLEEIGYNPTVMHELGFEIISDLDNLHAQKIERVFPVIAPLSHRYNKKTLGIS